MVPSSCGRYDEQEKLVHYRYGPASSKQSARKEPVLPNANAPSHGLLVKSTPKLR